MITKDNIFTILDNIFTKHLNGLESTIMSNEFEVTISNVAMTCNIEFVPKERFIVTFVSTTSNHGRGYVGRKGTLVVDSDGKISTNNNSTSVNTKNGWVHYQSIYMDEMLENLQKLKREYSLNSLLD